MRHRGFFLLALAACGFAQEITTEERPVIFSTGVNLVPVKVVVRDKEGRAIGDLQQSDFALQDRGKNQTIVRFSVERPEPQTAQVEASPVDAEGRPVLEDRRFRPLVIPERFLAFIFDDVHTDIGDLMMARESAVRMLDEVLDPATRVAVYSTSGQIQLDFTDDREAVVTAMRRVVRYSSDRAENDCPPITYHWATLVVVNRDQQATEAGVENLLLCMPGVSNPELLLLSMARQRLAIGQRETRMGLEIVTNVARRMSVMPGNRSIVYVSSGFMLDQTLRFEQQRVFEDAVKAKVVVNALDARGLYAPVMEASTRAQSPTLMQFRQRLERDQSFLQANVLGEFASATGGRFIWNTNAYDDSFRRLTGSPEYAYVLEFSPSNLKYDGSFHELKIRLNARPGLDVRNLEVFARNGYYAPSAEADAQEITREELRDAVFSREEVVDVPVEMSLQYFKASPVEAQLSVIAKVDLEGVRFRKADERNNDVLTVIAAVFDRNGNFVKGVQRVLDMKLRNETLERLLGQGGISVRTQLDLPPGSYLVRLVVRDAEGHAMAMRNGAVEIPF